MKISVIGLGKLGATTLIVLASKGFNVIGIDVNKTNIDLINNGIPPIYEPNLDMLLKKYKERITVTTDYKFVEDTDMTIIIVPTPSKQDGNFSTEYVEQAIIKIGGNIQKKSYHNVVVTSTILPGSMDEIIKPLLEEYSGKKVGQELGLCYNPDFIALGNVINDLTHPNMILIGESDQKAGLMVEQMHKQLVEPNNPPVHHMSFYNAELAKISLNAYITMKISFANTIAEICDKMPTGDVKKVLHAIGDDTRIGNKFLKSGLSPGGPCLPRDSRAFIFTASKYKVSANLAKATDNTNQRHVEKAVSYISNILSETGSNQLSVLGVTYKPDTVIVEESASFKIIKKLCTDGIQVTVYDPSIKLDANPQYQEVTNLKIVSSIEECLKSSQVCFIATPWDEFKELTDEKLLSLMKYKPVIIDAWGIQNHLRYSPDIKYRQLGVHDERHI